MTYKRVLLKLSGEAMGAPESGHGLHPQAIRNLSVQIARVVKSGVQVAIVCGGGNILRGAEFSELGAERASADYMGMLGTIINGLALSDALESDGVDTRVLTALEVRSVAEPYVRRRALRHLERGRATILAGGLGTPLFTTDTAAAQRAVELRCDVLLKATKVDGVYTADPKKDPDAKRLDSLSYMEVLNDRLHVMDGTAITMCMEHELPVIVFDLFEDGNLERVIQEQAGLGTRIRS
jgi:uridylate kinase